jgi:hypothetical protein
MTDLLRGLFGTPESVVAPSFVVSPRRFPKPAFPEHHVLKTFWEFHRKQNGARLILGVYVFLSNIKPPSGPQEWNMTATRVTNGLCREITRYATPLEDAFPSTDAHKRTSRGWLPRLAARRSELLKNAKEAPPTSRQIPALAVLSRWAACSNAFLQGAALVPDACKAIGAGKEALCKNDALNTSCK